MAPSNSIQILAVDCIRTSRNNLKFQTAIKIDEAEGKQIVQVNVLGDEALESMDGGLFQILFTGDNNVDFSVTGRVKGAPQGFKRKEWKSIIKPNINDYYHKLMMAFSGIYVLFGFSLIWRGVEKIARGLPGWQLIIMGVSLILMVAAYIVLVLGNPWGLQWVA